MTLVVSPSKLVSRRKVCRTATKAFTSKIKTFVGCPLSWCCSRGIISVNFVTWRREAKLSLYALLCDVTSREILMTYGTVTTCAWMVGRHILGRVVGGMSRSHTTPTTLTGQIQRCHAIWHYSLVSRTMAFNMGWNYPSDFFRVPACFFLRDLWSKLGR